MPNTLAGGDWVVRKAFVAVLLIMGCVLVGCGQGRSATPVRPAALSDPFLGTAALEKAIADGLPKEVEFLAEFATPEQAARLASATAGAPIPIRMPKYGSHPDSLRGYFSGNPVTYLVPTLVNGEPVGEYIISVSDSGKLELGRWDVRVQPVQAGHARGDRRSRARCRHRVRAKAHEGCARLELQGRGGHLRLNRGHSDFRSSGEAAARSHRC